MTSVLLSFGLIVAAGYLWRFFEPGGIDSSRLRQALGTAVLNVFLPALAFNLVASARLDRSFTAVPLTAMLVTVASMGAGLALYRVLPWFREAPRRTVGVMALSAAFGNVTYLGLPVITETLGSRFGYVAILYDLLAATPVLLTLGVFVAARAGSGREMTLQASLLRVLRLPPLWGVAAAILVHLFRMELPRPVLDATAMMGKAVIPVMIFTVGLALDFKDLPRLGIAVPALAVKLLLAPLLAWQVGSLLGLAGDVLRAVTIEGAMPVMVLSLVIADEFGLDVPLAAACIAASTVASFFTVPMMMGMLF